TIAGVAYGNQFPDRGPLKFDEFTGGEASVGPVLQRLGFTLERSADGNVASTSTLGSPTGSYTSSDGRRAWMFQANPTLFDLQGALQTLTNLSWLVRQHGNHIEQGDTVYLWDGGSDAGIVAVATVSAAPTMRGETAEEAKFNLDHSKFAGQQLRVLLQVEQ